MEVLSMTDKQWKGWLRRLSREGGLATALHQKKYNKYGISCK